MSRHTNPLTDRRDKQREAMRLQEPVRLARALARKLGLSPYRVNYWVVDHDEMNELIAYGGFQRRYPHWRWGMQYDRQRKTDRFGMGKAFEIVNNDDPSHAFLQESNALADQKAVITHVEAHADFFANNEWFRRFNGPGSGGTDGQASGSTDRGGESARQAAVGEDPRRRGPNAAAMLARHGDRIEELVADPSVERGDVERFIDAVLCLEDTIDQYAAVHGGSGADAADDADADIREHLADLGLSPEVERQVFDEAWLEAQAETTDGLDEPHRDVLGYLLTHGQAYDDEEGRAVDREPWQNEVLAMLRTESYYFAPQKLTKVMNEGWAAYWEALMMGDETVAGADEFVTYADHMSKVLASPGLNPYALGFALWRYVENRENRRQVVSKLLRVDGVSPGSFHDDVDFRDVERLLEPSPEMADPYGHLEDLDPADPRVDGEVLAAVQAGEHHTDPERHPWTLLTTAGLAERHYSLCRRQNRGFLGRVSRDEVAELARYLFDDARYDSVEAAVADVDRGAGWARMREVRESHNDVTFVDEFLSQEFVREQGYFAYEYSHAHGDYRATSTDVADVKKKLLLRFTNFGKPTVSVYDGNFANAGELLLGHEYNGVALDLDQARAVLERTFELWGRPVNLATIEKRVDDADAQVGRRRNQEPEPEETGLRIRYDGEEFSTHDLDPVLEDELRADEVDYDTRPEDWLA